MKTSSTYRKKIKLDQHTFKNEHGEDCMDEEIFDDDDDALRKQLSASLFERLKIYMKSLDIDNSIIDSTEQNIVSVKIVDDMVVAEVFCAVCHNDLTKKRKLKAKRVFYKGGEGSKYWVLSNFGQYLKNVHKLNSCSQANEASDSAIQINLNENESLSSAAIEIPLKCIGKE